MWNSGADLDCAERGEHNLASIPCVRTRYFPVSRPRINDRQSICHPHQHGYLFLDLLAAAEWEGSGQGGTAGGDHHGIAFGNIEIFLHSAVATTEFSGSVWAIRALGEHDVLGISFGVAVVDWGTPVRAEDILERGMKSKRGIPSSFERTRPPAVPLVVRAT